MSNPIILGGGGSSRPPSLKLANPSDTAVVAIADYESVDVTDIMTGAVKLKDNGKPRQQLVLTGILVSGNPVTGKVGEQTELAAGQEVTVYLPGHKYGAFIDAQKTLPGDGQVHVSDVMQLVYSGDEPSSMPGGAPKKVWQIALRRNDPARDGDLAAKCADLYHRNRDAKATVVSTPPPAQGGDNQFANHFGAPAAAAAQEQAF